MTGTFPYDAIETDEGVCFVVACQAPPARVVEARIVEGRGLEIACGRWLVRIANLHPRLHEACLRKRISIAAVDQAGVVVRGVEGIRPPLWREATFYWYLDARATNPEALARRPLPRALSLGGRTVVVASMGSLPYGAPVGMCLSSPILTALPQGKLWHRVCGGLLVDTSMLEANPPGIRSEETIGSSVKEVVGGTATSTVDGTPMWRPQLALLASKA